jgi:alkylation response protein AidB-like acyl-CoA dehydrogenase
VVEADAPGFRLGSRERKMGIRGTTGYELVFEDARVPAVNRLGDEGNGLRVALSALGAGRISIAAACTGLARNALELAARYALQRRQFGRAIADQEMIQAMLAEMTVQVEAARLLTWRAARMRDAGQPINAASSMAKWYASDAAMRVATDAVQIYGGAGYSRDNPVERLMRDAKGAQIYEGTNQIHRLIVAQGLLDAMRREG